jgi:hypothetical protein
VRQQQQQHAGHSSSTCGTMPVVESGSSDTCGHSTAEMWHWAVAAGGTSQQLGSEGSLQDIIDWSGGSANSASNPLSCNAGKHNTAAHAGCAQLQHQLSGVLRTDFLDHLLMCARCQHVC